MAQHRSVHGRNCSYESPYAFEMFYEFAVISLPMDCINRFRITLGVRVSRFPSVELVVVTKVR